MTARVLQGLALAVALVNVLLPPAAAAPAVDYDLPETGILLEGIGVADEGPGRPRTFYVSGVNDGGDVYRGTVGEEQLERWYDGVGTTGRGIDVDARGRVYVAGGPTGTVRVFDRHGQLLATVPTNTPGAFLNDLWVGPDGSVYVTDSSLPTVWRLVRSAGGWEISAWLDVSATITYTPDTTDFDLGGILVTRNGRYLLTSQGTTGQLWRIGLRDQQIVEVDLGGATIVNADGIVAKGRNLWVVQNFARRISRFRLDAGWDDARLRRVQVTPSNRTLTTAKLAKGRLLAVDSQFGFPPASAPAPDRVLSLRPWVGDAP